MSMKSFDKFCEKMILGEPGSEKEIYDERQTQLRTHILVQSLVIYAIASALCVVLNEFIGFLESDFSGMVFVAGHHHAPLHLRQLYLLNAHASH